MRHETLAVRAPCRIRTGDLLITSETRYQLRQGGKSEEPEGVTTKTKKTVA